MRRTSSEITLGGNLRARVDEQREDVGVGGGGPGGLRHRPVEPALGREQPGRVDEHDLRLPSTATPRTGARVVCALRETIDTFAPTSLLTSVDLPALGAPIRATKPQAVMGSPIARGKPCAAACSAARLEEASPRSGA